MVIDRMSIINISSAKASRAILDVEGMRRELLVDNRIGVQDIKFTIITSLRSKVLRHSKQQPPKETCLLEPLLMLVNHHKYICDDSTTFFLKAGDQ